jgi:hypothetical protein
MIINNQFYIFSYAGSKPLDLINAPPEVLEDPILLSQYNAFIQSVDTIYASQTINDDIPVFWTRRIGLVDDLGNTAVGYQPHPDCTLTQLDSKQSYYVIVRDLDSIPLVVPIIGETAAGFTDTSLAPIVSDIENILLTSDSGNTVVIRPEIGQLQQYETYSYEYKGLSANWPITVSPISGIIRPSSSGLQLSSVLSFCATSGACCSCVIDPDIVMGNIKNRCPNFNEINLYSTLELEVKPISFSGLPIRSSPFTIQCEDCLPRVRVNLKYTDDPSKPSGDPKSVINLTSTNTVDISGIISNLEPTQNYTYEYVSVGSNWPVMFITPISGVITSYQTNEDFTLMSKLFFCPTTGLCPKTDSSVLDYSIDPKFIESYYASFVLKISPNTCIEPYYLFQNSSSVYSSPITIYCNDCL